MNADSFIDKLPNGFDEPVTERGSTLSAGQRQLLSFARTLAYQPTILVLDEATANIDTETERLITQALEKLMEGRTTIMWSRTVCPQSSTRTRSSSCTIFEVAMRERNYAVSFAYTVLFQFMLCACGKKEQGNPIRLPAREDIVSIGVSDGDKYAMSPNTEVEATEFIDEFLSMLMDMETTSQQSVNDVPVNKDSITININCDGVAGTTLFTT